MAGRSQSIQSFYVTLSLVFSYTYFFTLTLTMNDTLRTSELNAKSIWPNAPSRRVIKIYYIGYSLTVIYNPLSIETKFISRWM